MKSDRERFDAAGFDGFMQKPVDVRTFASEVRRFSTQGRVR